MYVHNRPCLLIPKSKYEVDDRLSVTPPPSRSVQSHDNNNMRDVAKSVCYPSENVLYQMTHLTPKLHFYLKTFCG